MAEKSISLWLAQFSLYGENISVAYVWRKTKHFYVLGQITHFKHG